MSRGKPPCEVPVQDYARIQLMFLPFSAQGCNVYMFLPRHSIDTNPRILDSTLYRTLFQSIYHVVFLSSPGHVSLPAMLRGKPPCEVPVQDYARIQLMFLPGSALSNNGKLFTDFSFPPDKSSLTYVYSGDDKYEKMVFKRPKEICSYCVFTGVGGVYDAPFPWRTWRKSGWFQAAVAAVSLNFKHMDRLVPGYRHFDQSLQTDYIGCFCFKLWRFGEWIDIVVDDHLPTLNNELLYCQAYGAPREFWGPLVEKAYAKCKKTYEANECGRTLDALTDLTGGICEFYTPDVNAPDNLFHVLYKSCVNRSQIVCWRNDKLLTPTGFMHNSITDKGEDREDEKTASRYLHTVTASTKFPLSDERMMEMIRLYCPHKEEPTWNGKFGDSDEVSWANINSDFNSKYRPLTSKDRNEYWMTMDDFRCNFGGLLICSSETPYTTEGLNLERYYRRLSDDELKAGQGSKTIFVAKERRRSSEGKHRQATPSYFLFPRLSEPSLQRHRRRKKTSRSKSTPMSPGIEYTRKQSEPGILVRENTRTVKVDNTTNGVSRDEQSYRELTPVHSNKDNGVSRGGNGLDYYRETTPVHMRDNNGTSGGNSSPRNKRGSTTPIHSKDSSAIKRDTPSPCLKRLSLLVDQGKQCTRDSVSTDNSSPGDSPVSRRTNQQPAPASTCYDGTGASTSLPGTYQQNRSGSIISNSSLISDCHSTFSTSDIMLNLQGGCSRENSLKRPKSAPGNCSIVRSSSSGSLPNITMNNFMATSNDNFRSHGSWRSVMEVKGSWEKSESGVSSVDMKMHSRNSRMLLTIIHPDATNQIIAPCYHGRSHVVVSLLQDYRHGAPTANSLLVPIGFSVYKTKNPGKDIKRALPKLNLVADVTTTNESREISSRLDLHPGNYFIVPFCLSETHSGQFLLRVLAERDPVAGKTGCIIS